MSKARESERTLHHPDQVEERRRTRRFFNLAAPAFHVIDRRLQPEYRKALAELALSQDASVLDLATGTGTVAQAFAERGHRVAGMDFAERLLRRARQRLPEAHLHQMDLTDLPSFPNGAFDIVSMGYLLHGLPPLLRRFTLCEAARIAARHVLVFDYSRPGPWYVRLIERIEGPHYAGFVTTPFTEHAAAAGLAVVRSGVTSRFSGYWLCESQRS